jgi:hypothetical protein
MSNSQAIGVAYQDQDIVGSNLSFVNSTSGQFGYNTGSSTAVPTAVTQATSKSTGVTANTPCGTITMNGAALAAGVEVAFIVTNSTVSAYDVPVLAIKSGSATAGTYLLSVAAVAAGSFTVVVTNASAGSLSEALVISFALIHVAQQ